MTHAAHGATEMDGRIFEHQKSRAFSFVILAFACVYFFWGSTYTAIRVGVSQLPPFVLSGVRFLVAGAALLGCCGLFRLRVLLPLGTLLRLCIIGLLLLTTGNTSLVYAESRIPSGLASLIFAVTPVFIVLIEMALPRGEPLSQRGWLGIFMGFGGMVALLSPSLHTAAVSSTAQSGRGLAVLVCIAGALSWAIGSVYSRRQKLKVDLLVVSAWQMVFAGVFNALMATLFRQWTQCHWGASSLGSLAWLIVGGSWIGYSSYVYLLANVPVAKVATYAYVNPIVAVILGLLFLREHFSKAEGIGMTLIVVAVVLVSSATIKPKADSDTVPRTEDVAQRQLN